MDTHTITTLVDSLREDNDRLRSELDDLRKQYVAQTAYEGSIARMYCRAIDAAAFMQEPAWADKLGLRVGDDTITQGVPALKDYCLKLEDIIKYR